MKMSRFSFLFAVALFVAPLTVIAEENTEKTETTEQNKAVAKAGIVATVTTLMGTARTKVNNGLGTIGSYTFEPALNTLTKISYLKGGKFQENIPTISRVLTGAALVTVVYAIYKAYKAQQQEEIVDTDFDDNFNL